MRKLTLLFLPLMILCLTTFCGRSSDLKDMCKADCIGQGRKDLKKCKAGDQACKTGVVGKLRDCTKACDKRGH